MGKYINIGKMFNAFTEIHDSILLCRDLSPAAKILFAVLVKFSNRMEGCKLINEALAIETGMSVPLVKKSLTELIKYKLIIRIRDAYYFLEHPLLCTDMDDDEIDKKVDKS